MLKTAARFCQNVIITTLASQSRKLDENLIFLQLLPSNSRHM